MGGNERIGLGAQVHWFLANQVNQEITHSRPLVIDWHFLIFLPAAWSLDSFSRFEDHRTFWLQMENLERLGKLPSIPQPWPPFPHSIEQSPERCWRFCCCFLDNPPSVKHHIIGTLSVIFLDVILQIYAMVSVCAKSLQLCLTLCDPKDCSLPGSSVHGILQARILEWAAISSSRGSRLLLWQAGSLPLTPPGNPMIIAILQFKIRETEAQGAEITEHQTSKEWLKYDWRSMVFLHPMKHWEMHSLDVRGFY